MHHKELFKNSELAQNYLASYENTLSLWPVPFLSIYVETEYGSTHVIVSGPENGEPVILLNGFGFSATMWYPNVEILSKSYRVYAVDVIGEFNRSIPKTHFKERKDYVNWLTSLLDGLNIHQAHFIGHSNGGWHALNFAISMQQRVKKLILLAPAASFAPFAKQFGIRLLAANIIRTRSVIINFCAKWFIHKDNLHMVSNHLIEQFYHGIVGFAWKYKVLIPSVYRDEELTKISVPTFLIIGDKEVIYKPARVFARAKRLIPHISTLSIPGVRHGTNIEKPNYINQKMVEFLNYKK